MIDELREREARSEQLREQLRMERETWPVQLRIQYEPNEAPLNPTQEIEHDRKKTRQMLHTLMNPTYALRIAEKMANHFVPSSSASPLWTMILSLWSLLQVTAHFLAEHCHELITDLTVQLLFFITLFPSAGR